MSPQFLSGQSWSEEINVWKDKSLTDLCGSVQVHRDLLDRFEGKVLPCFQAYRIRLHSRFSVNLFTSCTSGMDLGKLCTQGFRKKTTVMLAHHLVFEIEPSSLRATFLHVSSPAKI